MNVKRLIAAMLHDVMSHNMFLLFGRLEAMVSASREATTIWPAMGQARPDQTMRFQCVCLLHLASALFPWLWVFASLPWIWVCLPNGCCASRYDVRLVLASLQPDGPLDHLEIHVTDDTPVLVHKILRARALGCLCRWYRIGSSLGSGSSVWLDHKPI